LALETRHPALAATRRFGQLAGSRHRLLRRDASKFMIAASESGRSLVANRIMLSMITTHTAAAVAAPRPAYQVHVLEHATQRVECDTCSSAFRRFTTVALKIDASSLASMSPRRDRSERGANDAQFGKLGRRRRTIRGASSLQSDR
jgi:hypothetical protein